MVRRRSIRRTLVGLSPAIPHLTASLARRDHTNRTVSTRAPSSSVRIARVRSVKPTRLIRFPHARDRPADRALLSDAARNLAARAGHAPTRPLRAAFRYPHPGAVARPCRTSGPSLLLARASSREHASSGGAPGVRPFAGLIPHPGGHDISVRPGPTCRSRRFSRVPIIFVGMTRRAIGDTTDVCGSKRAVDRAVDPASTSGLRLPSAVRPPSPRWQDDPALGFASCRVDGHMTVHRGGLDPDTIISLRSPDGPPFLACGRAAPIRSWV